MASKRIIWAGRLIHAKGKLGMKLATDIFPQYKDIQFEIYAGPLPNQEIIDGHHNVTFFGVVDNLIERMQGASLVLGGGRVALEAMSLNIPVMAVGQRCYVGILNDENIDFAKQTNFGDMHNQDIINYQQLDRDLKAFIDGKLTANTTNYQEYLQEYKLDNVVSEINKVYLEAMQRRQTNS